MRRLLLETTVSKIYIIAIILISLLLVSGYFSYAMFTVTKEKEDAIRIVTGNLTYKLEIDGEETNTLTVPANEVKDFTVTLSNPNNRIARFNLYYLGELTPYTKIGYIVEEGFNTPPETVGTNLEKSETLGSSNKYKVRVINNSTNSVTFNLGVSVGLDYNDLNLPSDSHLLEEITIIGEVGEVLVDDISKDSLYDDGVESFITGQYPNNYIWYSGKLWRAVSVNNSEKTAKLVTKENISSITYNEANNTAFAGSYMESWLNDTTVDGFLGNLREPEKFIVMDAKWNVVESTSSNRPEDTKMVTDPIGLLNYYEYITSYKGTDAETGYLNNGLWWWTLTSSGSENVWGVYGSGSTSPYASTSANGVRPSINLKSNVKIVSGDGTEANPYRLEGDNDTNLSGTLLNTRYSGEYIRFGKGENNLYRIVSHENGIGTKITSNETLKESGTFKTIGFGNDSMFSSSNTIGFFLNGEYLTAYIDDNYSNMIEDNTTWYLGSVTKGTSYKLAKYTDETGDTLTSSTTTAKVGLLRFGELIAGQSSNYENNTNYWTITSYSDFDIWSVYQGGDAFSNSYTYTIGIRPSLNLKQNVIITGGTGTKRDPFTLELKV